VITRKAPAGFKKVKESYTEEETHQEQVVVKPGGLFRRAVKETVTKTRMVNKTREVNKAIESIVDNIYTGVGKK
jgi:hypothetical protein